MKILIPVIVACFSLYIGFHVGFGAGEESGRVKCNQVRMMEYNHNSEFKPTADSLVYYKMEMIEINDTY